MAHSRWLADADADADFGARARALVAGRRTPNGQHGHRNRNESLRHIEMNNGSLTLYLFGWN